MQNEYILNQAKMSLLTGTKLKKLNGFNQIFREINIICVPQLIQVCKRQFFK